MRRSRSVHFFATTKDIEALLKAVESSRPVKYIKAGMDETPDVIALNSFRDIPDLGIAITGDQIHERRWLMLPPTAKVYVETVPQRRGGKRYAIDQGGNPSSVTIRPCGVYENSAIIAGEIGIAIENAESHVLLNLLAHEIRRQFKRIKSYFVGPEAEKLLASGFRLTANLSAPPECDLSAGPVQNCAD